ncbi:tryptophan-rich sensory protein [Microbacterium sorbitolivorans]|uniref:Tryptophan-rich sensory protein n=1 Tax=Microbacterium sorbitolivorans TaxID=1867410 RepID=A0A367XY86_9MICO|nr:TspO/MBR family protein [Microbacterium sorbitolivorans]RCK58568.1 tryptophan-rich sensory protein [Microbacterium sorbitolivorans]GGF37571.1 tryptophan-rich sensory protein [Microbacterium sorbitolivorans]
MTRTPSLARQIIVAAVILIAVVAVAAGGSLATMGNVDGWYADAEKVPWNPPNALFGPVWSVLYLMIALSGFLLWRWAAKDGRRWDPALTVYVVQLALNAAWTPIFFAGYPVIGEAAWWIALIVMLALIVSVVWYMGLCATRIKTSGWLLAPYLVWIIYASTLNAGVAALN